MWRLDTTGPLSEVLADLNSCIGQTSIDHPESAQMMTEGQRFIGVMTLGVPSDRSARLVFCGTPDPDQGTLTVTLEFQILPSAE